MERVVCMTIALGQRGLNMKKLLGPPSPYDYASDWDYYDALEHWEDEVTAMDDYIPEEDE
jgi:hypothetical protein